MKWKDKLLSSSLPLEYEVAKMLAGQGFSINFDYAYKRLDAVLEKEFSIDIQSLAWYPFRHKAGIKMGIDILVECKYRNPNVSWLFLHDLNLKDYSNFSTYGPIKMVDEFSEVVAKKGVKKISDCQICLKGMEINTQNGEVHDTGIAHGISQLVYALPSVLYQRIFASLVDHLSEVRPFILCPILVTTAPLRIIKPEFSIAEVMNASELNDISYEVPYLSMYNSMYPSFGAHCKEIFKNIISEGKQDRFEHFKSLRKLPKDKDNLPLLSEWRSQPELLLLDLQLGHVGNIFRETLICNFNHLPSLLKHLKSSIEHAGKSLTKL